MPILFGVLVVLLLGAIAGILIIQESNRKKEEHAKVRLIQLKKLSDALIKVELQASDLDDDLTLSPKGNKIQKDISKEVGEILDKFPHLSNYYYGL
jgi:gas vesicle protein